MKYNRRTKYVFPVLAMLSQPVFAADQPVMFPPEQFGRTFLSLPQSTVHLESVLGQNTNFERLIDYSVTDRFRVLSNPVGRLDLLVQQGKRLGVVTCTASIISSDYVLTNNHCAPGKHNRQKIVKAQLLMNFYGVETEEKTQRFDLELPAVEQDVKLDYAIYRVGGNPSKLFGRIALTPRDPVPGESLVIIHHPAGLAKHLTRGGCLAVAPKAIRNTDILHRCDTLPGSSGSPIIASSTGLMIGLHYAGSSGPSASGYNYGKRLVRIVKKSPIIRSILTNEADEQKRKAQIVMLQEERERQRREDELRARIEKELREKIQRGLNPPPAHTAPDGGTTDTGRALDLPPIESDKLNLADISIPVPQGEWRRVFSYRSSRNQRNAEMEFGASAEMHDGRVRQLLLTLTNTGGRDLRWRGTRGHWCKNGAGKTYFSHFDHGNASQTVCWRFRKFKWDRYPTDQAGGIEKVEGMKNKVAYFLTSQNEFAPFFGFSFHVTVGGQFVRVIYAFNSEIFDKERTLHRAQKDLSRKKVTGVAKQVTAALINILKRENVDFAAVSQAFSEVR